MKILILGSGGREHSIGLAISKEKEQHSLYFMPGNGGTDNLGTNINIKDYKILDVFYSTICSMRHLIYIL